MYAGYPWWPALTVPYETVLFLPVDSEVPRPDRSKVVLQFFSDGRISLVRPQDVQLFDASSGKALLPKQGTQFASQVHHAYDAANAYALCAARRKSASEAKAQREQGKQSELEALQTERNELRKQQQKSQRKIRAVKAESNKRIAELQHTNVERSSRLERYERAGGSASASTKTTDITMRDARLLECTRSSIDILQGNNLNLVADEEYTRNTSAGSRRTEGEDASNEGSEMIDTDMVEEDVKIEGELDNFSLLNEEVEGQIIEGVWVTCGATYDT